MDADVLGVVRGLSRRQALLLAISGVTLVATLPVVGHHAWGGEPGLFAGRDNIGELCLVALHVILAPVHYGFHIALVLGVLYAVSDRARAWSRLKGGIGRLPLVSPPPRGPFAAAIAAAGLDTESVRIVQGLANPAFTAGWLKPRIYLAAELPLLLSGEELERLVAHEATHLRRRDPLRLAVLRFFACMLFWIPALRKLAADVADEAEFEADEAAANGKPLILASAILTVALWKKAGSQKVPGVGFLRYDLVEQRVRRLSGEAPPRASHVTSRSLIGATAMLAVVLTSGIVVAHPLQAAPTVVTAEAAKHAHGAGSGHSGKCRYHEEPVFFHLLCAGLPFGLAGVDCPHHGHAESRPS